MILPDSIELFLRLVLAYLLVDFTIQPDFQAKSRFSSDWRPIYPVPHALMAGGLTFFLANLWDIAFILKDPSSLPEFLPQFCNTLLYAFVLVAAAHLVIDGVKPWRMVVLRGMMKSRDESDATNTSPEDTVRTFPTEIVAHLAVLLIVLAKLAPQTPVPHLPGTLVEMIRIWIVIIAFLLALQPGGMLVSKSIQPWRRDLDSPEEDGLNNAGRLIGYVERLLIVTFILVHEYTAIGFLIAAKGLFRINDMKRSEYIIVGTLVSFVIAVLIGVATSYLIHQGGIEQIIRYCSELL